MMRSKQGGRGERFVSPRDEQRRAASRDVATRQLSISAGAAEETMESARAKRLRGGRWGEPALGKLVQFVRVT